MSNKTDKATPRPWDLSEKQIARFWSKVAITGGCWFWSGAKDLNGYGQFRSRIKTRQAHIVSYNLKVGIVPSGLELNHVCKNRDCVNPSHLEPVTHRENILRGNTVMAENARKTHCLRGHELSGNNLRINPRGERQCKLCDSERSKKYRSLRAATNR